MYLKDEMLLYVARHGGLVHVEAHTSGAEHYVLRRLLLGADLQVECFVRRGSDGDVALQVAIDERLDAVRLAALQNVVWAEKVSADGRRKKNSGAMHDKKKKRRTDANARTTQELRGIERLETYRARNL